MKRILILDDDVLRVASFRERLCHEGVKCVWVRTASSAIEQLRWGRWDHVFLDHDLGLSGAEAGSGTEVVQFIATYPGYYKNTKFWVHSANDDKAGWMVRVLRLAGLHVTDAPEAWDRVELKRK